MTRRTMLLLSALAGLCLTPAQLLGSDRGASAEEAKITPMKTPAFDPDVPTDLAVQSNNALAIDLYRQFAEQGGDTDNLFFSPISVSAALMLTYEGARGETQGEFEKVLSLQDADGKFASHKSYAGVLGRLDGQDKPYELSPANAVWVERTLPLRDEFVGTLKKHYQAGFESVDFKNEAEKNRQRINGWVEDRTHDRIKDLLPDGSLDAMTRLVLVNAIYFKAPWASQFSERATQDAPFHLLPAGNADEKQADENKAVTVPMMRQFRERFYHADLDGYDALKMFYESGDLSMVVLLPDERAGLPALEKKLTGELIDNTVKKLKPELVNLTLPKWETTQDYDLKPALSALGMNLAFDGQRADFTGISDSAEAGELYISKAVHKAFIAVDEEGTEAAAATAIAIATFSAPVGDPVEFRCNHPFIYLIRDERTGAILFMGRVTDPS